MKFFKKYLLLLIAITSLLIGMNLLPAGEPPLSTLLPAIMLVCFGFLLLFSSLVFLFQTYLQKTKVRLLVFYVFLCLGMLCYFGNLKINCLDNNSIKLLTSVFSSVAEFFPSRGEYPLKDYQQNHLMLLFYLLSYFFAISFLIAVFGQKLTNKWLLLQTKLTPEKRRIFWCEVPGDKEMLLVDDINKNSPTANCIFSVKESALEDIPRQMQHLNFKGNMLCLRKPGQFHPETLNAPVHFFITDDCSWNIGMAQQVWNQMTPKTTSSKVDFYIRISSGVKSYWAIQWAEKIQGYRNPDKPKIEIHLLQEPELIARKFEQDNPLLLAPQIEIVPNTGKIKGSFKILILGFGDLGEAILRESICDGQFLHIDATDTFSIDIVDHDQQRFDLFAARCEQAIKEYNISFYEKDVRTGDFYAFMSNNISSYNRIILAFYDRTLNMASAAQIVEIAKNRGVDLKSKLFVNLPETHPGMRNTLFPEFTVFGSMKECYSQEIIIHEKLDEKAKIINHAYKGFAGNKAELWRDLPYYKQDSNRCAAIGLYNVCRLMNISDPDNNFDTERFNANTTDELLEAYAETEHLRWNAFHFVRGIRKWDVSNIQKISKANDIAYRNRHAALVPYAELPVISKKCGETLQSYDRDNIKLIAQIFAQK